MIPWRQFFELLGSDAHLEGFIRYLSLRIARQSEVISLLATAGSEHRLGMTLLELGQSLGKKERHGLTIEHKISYEELSKMVGTTHPRISEFMRRFRELGLIEISAQHWLVVRDKDLSDYLTQLASC